MKRFLLATMLAVPLAIVGFGIADNAHVPTAVRYIVSPGDLIPVLPANSLAESINKNMSIELGANFVYYSLLLIGIFTLLARPDRDVRRL